MLDWAPDTSVKRHHPRYIKVWNAWRQAVEEYNLLLAEECWNTVHIRPKVKEEHMSPVELAIHRSFGKDKQTSLRVTYNQAKRNLADWSDEVRKTYRVPLTPRPGDVTPVSSEGTESDFEDPSVYYDSDATEYVEVVEPDEEEEQQPPQKASDNLCQQIRLSQELDQSAMISSASAEVKVATIENFGAAGSSSPSTVAYLLSEDDSDTERAGSTPVTPPRESSSSVSTPAVSPEKTGQLRDFQHQLARWEALSKQKDECIESYAKCLREERQRNQELHQQTVEQELELEQLRSQLKKFEKKLAAARASAKKN